MSGNKNLPAIPENLSPYANENELQGFRATKERNLRTIKSLKAHGMVDILNVPPWLERYEAPQEASADDIRIQLNVMRGVNEVYYGQVAREQDGV